MSVFLFYPKAVAAKSQGFLEVRAGGMQEV